MLGKRVGVSHGTVRKAEAILDKVAEGMVIEKDIDDLRKGKVKINRIYKKYCSDQSTASKAKQPKQGIAERSDSIIRLIKMQVARSFSQSEDCTSLYDKIIEWAKAQKAEVSSQ